MTGEIVRARRSHLRACAAAVRDSDLGRTYFEPEDDLVGYPAAGMKTEELFVVPDDAGRSQGFIWFVLNGAFHRREIPGLYRDGITEYLMMKRRLPS